MIKKVISAILCAAVIFGCCVPVVQASEATPVILVAGYAGCNLYLNYGEDDCKQVWNINAEMVLNQAKTNIPNMMLALFKTFLGNPYAIGWDVGNQGVLMLEQTRCGDDGLSVYPLTTYPNKAELCSYKYMLENTDGSNIMEKDFAKQLAEVIGGENVFVFHTDHRLAAVDTARQMKDFVDDVKAYTNSEKVNLFGLSHGGMIVGVYLSMFGTDGSVNNAVMSVPALGGTDIATNVLNADVKLADSDLMTFLETAISADSNLSRLFEADKLNGLDEIARGFLEGFHDAVINWGSLWDFIPAEDYEQMKAKYLDSEKNELLIEKADYMHNVIMPNYNTNFERCIESGVDISILCSTGSGIALGSDTNADTVIHASSVSGAVCAPLGKRFADGYTCIGKNCSNPDHNHLSPSMEVDASCAYLPENTWFIDEQYHGMYFWEDYSNELAFKLLMTEEIDNVHSNPEFPQFEVSQHTNRGIHAKFNSSNTGYVGGGDTALTITNVSKEKNVKIMSVICDGIDLTFDLSDCVTLAPGEKASVPFSGEIPAVSVKRAAVTVNYLEIGSVPALNSRTFDITILNGARVAYNSQAPYEDVDFVSGFEQKMPAFLYNIIVRLGMRKSLQVIFETISAFFMNVL